MLAYADPWNSPVGGQLEPAGREPVCAALNSAILGICFHLGISFTDDIDLESKNLPGRPPLEISLAHSAQLLKLMSHRCQILIIKRRRKKCSSTTMQNLFSPVIGILSDNFSLCRGEYFYLFGDNHHGTDMKFDWIFGKILPFEG